MPTASMTLAQFLIRERRKSPVPTEELNSLIVSVALACKCLASEVGRGALAGVMGTADSSNFHGDTQLHLGAIANESFLRCVEREVNVAALASEEIEELRVSSANLSGKFLLAFDPLDGSSNMDANVSVGSIFSILFTPAGSNPATLGADAFRQPGSTQVAAGYAIYGPSTMLVISVGTGVHAFTLERSIGEFVLTHPNLRIPKETSEFSINASNSRFWEPPVKRYVAECLAGEIGPRARDFNMRWIASLVAEAHRILMRGGVFLYPRDRKDSTKPGRLRLLYEANPIGFLIEQAGGRASTGRTPLLAVTPEMLHQPIGLVFGSREEVERIERYHAEDSGSTDLDLPLFHDRGLFRDSVMI